jgi:putative hemolysin
MTFSPVETECYRLRLAQSAADLRRAQRLRYEVFNLELQEGLAASAAQGLDVDEFDPHCEHLLVEESATGQVVGTYRLQTGQTAARAIGYYGEREFDFSPFAPVRSELLELGRACVAAAHRNQTVLGLLWRGIATRAEQLGARYLVGCSSLTSRRGAEGLAAFRQLQERHWVEPRWRTLPWPAWRCTEETPETQPVKIPRLMTAYLHLGAKICGEPALDREFGTIDFLTWLDLRALAPRVYNRFFA